MNKKVDIHQEEEFTDHKFTHPEGTEPEEKHLTRKAKKPAEGLPDSKSRGKEVHHPQERQISDLKKNLKKMRKERDQLRDQYLRGLAEIDNQQKRMQKEKEEYRRFILRDFLLELLEVYDNLERALQIRPQSKEGMTLLSGVQMTYNQLVSILKKYQVVEIDALNKPFDPNFHQALTKVEKKDIEEDTVIEVFQKGFTYHGRLLRPALARVAVPKED